MNRKEILSSLYSQDIENFEKLHSFLRSDDKFTIRIDSIRNSLKDVIEPDFIGSVFSALVPLAHIKRENPQFDVVSALNVEHEELHDNVVKKRDILLKIYETQTFKGITKAITLGFESGTLFQSISSVVDVRPIFSDDRSAVIANIIVPTIKISSFDPTKGETSSINLTLDEEDITMTIDALSDIVNKIRTIKKIDQYSDHEKCIIAGEVQL